LSKKIIRFKAKTQKLQIFSGPTEGMDFGELSARRSSGRSPPQPGRPKPEPGSRAEN